MSGPDIQAIIDKYGRPAFDAAMRQVWVDVWTNVAIAVLCLIALPVLVVVVLKLHKAAANGDRYDNMGAEMGQVFASIGTAIVAIGLLLTIFEAARLAANPTWYAIQTLASLLPGK